ncbi:MAG: HAD family hydrolase [bacterium]|nr:HAD family hydrolase [bacterium]
MLFIFDFDSTLAELQGVPWKEVKEQVIEYGESQGFEIDPSIHLVNTANHISDTKERKAEVDRIFREYEKKAVEAGTFRVYESTIPTLQTLRNLGHKTAIASNNTEPTVREVVEATGIPVDAIRGRTSVFRPKPFPDMLQSIMEEFGVPKEETSMTGDNFWDEGAGKAAGVKTFIIKPGTLDISLYSV